jgi:endonuclease/exonuclease/phosphatase family metal-dependent hydrolase
MCGDLNIIHEAPAMREIDFLRDLTEENNIKNTLSGLKFNGEVACDHILVNDLIEVQHFEVLDDLISDHKALAIDIK